MNYDNKLYTKTGYWPVVDRLLRKWFLEVNKPQAGQQIFKAGQPQCPAKTN